MSKSSISLLQELMIKRQLVPNYVLLHDGGGTHLNHFSIEVSCAGVSAIATGRSKKYAKEKAASILLKKIASSQQFHQSEMLSIKSLISLPVSPQKLSLNEVFDNAVGQLQELCTVKKIQSPKYEEVSCIGPPHAKIFKFHCKLSSFIEEGTGSNKKQAKQAAAKKMLTTFTEAAKTFSKINSEETFYTQMNRRNTLIASELGKIKYFQFSERSDKSSNNRNTIHDVYKLKSSFDPQTLNKMWVKLEELEKLAKNQIDNFCKLTFICLKAKFQMLMSPIGMSLDDLVEQKRTNTMHIVYMRLHTSPPIVEIGTDAIRSKAEACVLVKIIDTVMLLLR